MVDRTAGLAGGKSGGSPREPRLLAFDTMEGRILLSGRFVDFPTRFGSTGVDVVSAIATDRFGNVYVAGNFSGTVDFEPTVPPDVTDTLAGTDGNSFVSKYDRSGVLLWVRNFGGRGSQALGIAVDMAGNVYTTGGFAGTGDFDPNPDVKIELTKSRHCRRVRREIQGRRQARLGPRHGRRRDRFGHGHRGGLRRQCVHHRLLRRHGGGSTVPRPSSTPGATGLFSRGRGSHGRVRRKLDADGNFAWARGMGGTGGDRGNGIAVDESGAVFATGSFQNKADFDPNTTPGVQTLTSAGGTDVFVAMLVGDGRLAGSAAWAGIPTIRPRRSRPTRRASTRPEVSATRPTSTPAPWPRS